MKFFIKNNTGINTNQIIQANIQKNFYQNKK